jgi:hypothetical protein
VEDGRLRARLAGGRWGRAAGAMRTPAWATGAAASLRLDDRDGEDFVVLFGDLSNQPTRC